MIDPIYWGFSSSMMEWQRVLKTAQLSHQKHHFSLISIRGLYCTVWFIAGHCNPWKGYLSSNRYDGMGSGPSFNGLSIDSIVCHSILWCHSDLMSKHIWLFYAILVWRFIIRLLFAVMIDQVLLAGSEVSAVCCNRQVHPQFAEWAIHQCWTCGQGRPGGDGLASNMESKDSITGMGGPPELCISMYIMYWRVNIHFPDILLWKPKYQSFDWYLFKPIEYNISFC